MQVEDFVLDHGYVREIEHWGSDERIIETARMSTNKGFRTWEPYVECTKCSGWLLSTEKDDDVSLCSRGGPHNWRSVPKGDFGLLSYLHNNAHATPFEFAGLVVEVKLPIFVVREWHRHRTQSYNEMSARYVPLPDENYVPSLERCMVVNAANKQANAVQGADVLTHEGVIQWLSALEHAYEVSERAYQFGLQIGVPKELARLSVPVGRYTKMRAQANLRNWLAFLTLRSAPNAQWEIRQFADVVGRIIAKTYPRTWELFVGE
jgi:thymidylate synthase (FAD)